MFEPRHNKVICYADSGMEKQKFRFITKNNFMECCVVI